MKGKFMIIAALLGALTFGACVDTEESASVTAIRNAKAEQLKSIATLNNAKAQAEATLAAAEAALLQAQAQKAAAEAAAQNAQTEAQKIANELEAAKNANEIAKLQAQLEYDLLQMQYELLQLQATVNAEKDSQFAALYNAYTSALNDLYEAQKNVSDLTIALNGAEYDKAYAEALSSDLLGQEQAKLAKAQKNLADAEAELAILRSVAKGGISAAEADAKIAELNKANTAAQKNLSVANEKYVRAKEAAEAVDANFTKNSSKHAYQKAKSDLTTNNNKLNAAAFYDKAITLDGKDIKSKLNAGLTFATVKVDTNGDKTPDTDFWGYYTKKWDISAQKFVDGDFVKLAYPGATAHNVDYNGNHSNTKNTKYDHSKYSYSMYDHQGEFVAEDAADAYEEVVAEYIELTYGAVVVVAEANVEAAEAAFEKAFEKQGLDVDDYQDEIDDLKELIADIKADIVDEQAIIADCQYLLEAFGSILSKEDKEEIEADLKKAEEAIDKTAIKYDGVEYKGMDKALDAAEKALEDLNESKEWEAYCAAVKELTTIEAVYAKAVETAETAVAKLEAMEDNNEDWIAFAITAHNTAWEAARVDLAGRGAVDKVIDDNNKAIKTYNDLKTYIAGGDDAKYVSNRIDELVAAIGSVKSKSGYLYEISELEYSIANWYTDTYDEEWAIEKAKTELAVAQAKLAYAQAKVNSAKAALDAYTE